MKNQIEVATPEYVKVRFEIAGLGTRLIAQLIDLLLLALILISLSIAAAWFLGTWGVDLFIGNTWSSQSFIFVIYLVILMVFPFAYFVAFEYFMKGQTLGKRMLGIRIVMDDGRSASFFTIFLRNVMRLVDLLPSAYLVGVICMFINKEEKRLGDVVAGTLVVRENKSKQRSWKPGEAVQASESTTNKVRLQPHTESTVSSFLARREQLTPEKRQQLAKRLAEQVAAESGYLFVEGNEESYLEEMQNEK
ncbi:RDD family protein [Mechercharimyces sp. CAU 1602]|uniref:RDD family protein n=1 Tax=Mechercharimyces sp. CAU 1602 TaxID=2973933 RepID=UPI002163399C|nr:RDD family protein [Mechercharimyces sp. CAU 1602]MCS1351103.1 RDD family protein [Mechercharimyces sp. CAU 1602]